MEEEAHPSISLDETMRRHAEAVLRSTDGKMQVKYGVAAIIDIHPSTLPSRLEKPGVAFGRKIQNRS